MKCKDFYAIGVVTYVERENSEAIRKIYLAKSTWRDSLITDTLICPG